MFAGLSRRTMQTTADERAPACRSLRRPARPRRVYRRNGGALSVLDALVVRDYAGQAEVVLAGELLRHLELPGVRRPSGAVAPLCRNPKVSRPVPAARIPSVSSKQQ
jgi:hypothetical protein